MAPAAAGVEGQHGVGEAGVGACTVKGGVGELGYGRLRM